MLLVTNCATLTPGEGALSRNSTRDPVGNRNWVTRISHRAVHHPGIDRYCVNPTISNFCGRPSYSTCRSRMVSAVLLVTRQNCVSPGIM